MIPLTFLLSKLFSDSIIIWKKITNIILKVLRYIKLSEQFIIIPFFCKIKLMDKFHFTIMDVLCIFDKR